MDCCLNAHRFLQENKERKQDNLNIHFSLGTITHPQEASGLVKTYLERLRKQVITGAP